MNITFFQIINYCLIAFALVLFSGYIWDRIVNPDYMPEEWKHARKNRVLSRTLLKTERKYVDKVRFFNFWLQVERLRKDLVPGAFAELGVYKGQSAKVIHHMDPARKFHLFDTFSGFNALDLEKETGEAATYTTNNFADTSTDLVIARIGGNGNIILHPGNFPASAGEVIYEKFAFVNIDADLYKPTKAGLEFFYPRLSPGGVIMVHDYNHKWEGVMKAVDDFCKSIPESMIIVPDRETTVMIIRRKF
ncbi:MAG: TylF/MycF/NovP-related O-methyltransferase [Bacteroidota bacterium]